MHSFEDTSSNLGWSKPTYSKLLLPTGITSTELNLLSCQGVLMWACLNLPVMGYWAPKGLVCRCCVGCALPSDFPPHRADVAGLPAWHSVRGTPFARQVARIFFLGALNPLPTPLLTLCRRSLQFQQSTPILSSSLASFSSVSKPSLQISNPYNITLLDFCSPLAGCDRCPWCSDHFADHPCHQPGYLRSRFRWFWVCQVVEFRVHLDFLACLALTAGRGLSHSLVHRCCCR